MKKLSSILVVLFCLCTLSSHAQSVGKGAFSFIPRVGIDFAKLSNHEVYTDVSGLDKVSKAKFKPGFVVGANVEYMALDNLGIELGFQYAREGSNHDFEASEVSLDYINVPLMANIYVVKGLSLKTGAQFGWLLNAKDRVDDVNIDIKDDCNGFCFAIPLGLAYEFDNFVFNARYNFALSNVINKVNERKRSQLIQLTFGYKFSL